MLPTADGSVAGLYADTTSSVLDYVLPGRGRATYVMPRLSPARSHSVRLPELSTGCLVG